MPNRFSPKDRDYLIRTVIGEAANQPRQGKAAVAHTIFNRRNTGRWGDSVQDVVLAKNQFEPWGTRADELYSISPESEVYQQTGQLVDKVAAGHIPDPTKGGLYFLNPEIVRQRRGGSLPNWAQNETASIGQHTFYRGPGKEGTDMAVGTRNPRRGQVYMPEVEPGTGNLAQPQGRALPTRPSPNRGGRDVDIPGRPSKTDMSMAEALMQGGQRDIQNTRGTGLGLAGALAQQLSGAYMAGQYDDERSRYDDALAKAMAGAESRDALIDTMMRSGDPKYVSAAAQARLAQEKPTQRFAATDTGMIFDETTGDVIRQGTDPSLAASREEEGKQVGKSRAERRTKIYEDAREAVANNRRLRGFEELNKKATTGGWLSEASLGAKRFLGFFGVEPQSIGLEDNASLNETLKALTTRSALDVSQQTKGAITEREMDMFIEAVPSLRNTKEGNQLIIDFLRAANNRRIALNQRAVEYVRAHGTLDEGFVGDMQAIYEANPIPDLSGYMPQDAGQSIQPGTVEDGYRFKGGDPSDRDNWERVRQSPLQAGPTPPGPAGYAR